jgi:hypothetical protein
MSCCSLAAASKVQKKMNFDGVANVVALQPNWV